MELCVAQVRSSFHDGFDMHWHHMKCAMSKARTADDIKGFQRLRWSHQIEMAATLGCEPCMQVAPCVL